MKAFSCNGCGACCRAVKFIDPNWPTRLDGACINLTVDNRCAIYETRPLICRVDEGRPAAIPVEKWHQMNEEACAQLLKAEGK